ncbi:hypothetical protein Clacol_006530 [Clathrus columnatus]|uniref:Uncharacterized protein n=1 Tax=Clathrus columnatus TaxID=1419009 RepID=A0AAV5AGJ9_9AGAM|nr:hypothetical protein Clacol_006530 [Clathrus columnatus]
MELKSVQNQIENARALSEEYTSKENNLIMRCRTAEEETKMAMSVINDYAALVRSLQRDLTLAKKPEKGTELLPSTDGENGPSTVVLNSFQHSRNSLHQLLFESNSETASLHIEITRLHNELSSVRTDLEAERESSRINSQRLAEALVDIERRKTDDLAAERMVSRYMRFSQSSINALQTAVSSLRTRHAATLTTLSSTSETLSKLLEEERTRSSQMRDILDGLTEDISRETYGRRREVLLRLQYMAREERLLEGLKGWIRQAEEQYSKIPSLGNGNASDHSSSSILLPIYKIMIEEARNILVSTNYSETKDFESLSRIVLAEQLCSSLAVELENETKNRLELAKRVANDSSALPLATNPQSKKVQQRLTTEHNTPSEADQSENGPVTRDLVVFTFPHTESEKEINNFAQSPPNPPSEIQSQDPSLDDGKIPAEQFAIDNPPDPPGDTHEVIADDKKPLLINSKWEVLQKGLTDCHSALQQLKVVLSDKTTNISESRRSLLLNVVLRLDDYCEDARVELEIHITDTERIERGIETARHLPSLTHEIPKDELNQLFGESVIDESRAFQTRLDNLNHDIIQVKAALSRSESPVSSSTLSPSKSAAWPFFSSSPTHATPSFGAVITTPKPRRVYSLAGYSNSQETLPTNTKDPYAHLGLRISMPSHHPPWESSPLGSPRGGGSHQLKTARSSSSLYQLGLHSSSRIFNDDIPHTPTKSLNKEGNFADVE